MKFNRGYRKFKKSENTDWIAEIVEHVFEVASKFRWYNKRKKIIYSSTSQFQRQKLLWKSSRLFDTALIKNTFMCTKEGRVQQPISIIWSISLSRNTPTIPTSALVQFADLPGAYIHYRKLNPPWCICTMCTHTRLAGTPLLTSFIPRYMLVDGRWRETRATSSRRYAGANWSSPWQGLNETGAERIPPEWNPVTIMPWCPARHHIRRQLRAGLVAYLTTGWWLVQSISWKGKRGIHFDSKAYHDSSKHPSATVLSTEWKMCRHFIPS